MSVWNRGASRNKTLVRGKSTIEQRTTILNESFLEADGSPHAGVFTVQFTSRSVQGLVPQDQNPTITYAQIDWTIDGNHITRTVSVADGQTVTGVGCGCTINIYDDTDVIVGVPDTSPDYLVTVSLSPGSRGSNGNPPTLFTNQYTSGPSGTINTGSAGVIKPDNGVNDFFVNVFIPQDSGVISVQVTVGTFDNSEVLNCRISQFDGAGTNVKIYNNANYTGFIPIDPRATGIEIVNKNTTDDLYWGICFGVDG